jgi:hypothetical protein
LLRQIKNQTGASLEAEAAQDTVLVHYLMAQMQEGEQARFERAKGRDQIQNDPTAYYNSMEFIRKSNQDASERKKDIDAKKAEFDHLNREQKQEIKAQQDQEITSIISSFKDAEIAQASQVAASEDIDPGIFQNIWDVLRPIPTHAILDDLKTGIDKYKQLQTKSSTDELCALKLKMQISQQHFYNSALFYSLEKANYFFVDEMKQEIRKIDEDKNLCAPLFQHIESELESQKAAFKVDISYSFNQLNQDHHRLHTKWTELGYIAPDADYTAFIDSPLGEIRDQKDA